jgi:Ni/Co efflux regulator RcnB
MCLNTPPQCAAPLRSNNGTCALRRVNYERKSPPSCICRYTSVDILVRTVIYILNVLHTSTVFIHTSTIRGAASKHNVTCALRRMDCDRKSPAVVHRRPTSARPPREGSWGSNFTSARSNRTRNRRGKQLAPQYRNRCIVIHCYCYCYCYTRTTLLLLL